MDRIPANTDRLHYLAGAVCNRTASESDFVELDALLRSDETARTRYVEYCRLHTALRLQLRARRGTKKVQQQIGLPGTSLYDTIGHIIQQMSLSFSTATVALAGIVLLIALLIHVFRPAPTEQVAKTAPPSAPTIVTPKAEIVGRISGLIDCQWADPETETVNDAVVTVGRRYALQSGLLEITYDTGAKVILQGPATYEVMSAAWGHLSAGRLTVRVEKEARDKTRTAMTNRIADEGKQGLFTVKTPTVIVTDLGTEFGVNVQQEGAVEVFVTEGRVETTQVSRDGAPLRKQHLVVGEAVRFASADAIPVRIANPPKIVTNSTLAAVRKARQAMPLRPFDIVATAYHRIWDYDGKLLGEYNRRMAFVVATDFVIGGANAPAPRSSFDTFDPDRPGTQFVGLLYDRRVRIDRIKVCFGSHFGDSGNWMAPPRLFILKNPVDTNQTRPEEDPGNWRELPLNVISGKAGRGEAVEIILTNHASEDRTGYGWAVGGIPCEGANYLSITELYGFGKEASE